MEVVPRVMKSAITWVRPTLEVTAVPCCLERLVEQFSYERLQATFESVDSLAVSAR